MCNTVSTRRYQLLLYRGQKKHKDTGGETKRKEGEMGRGTKNRTARDGDKKDEENKGRLPR